MGERDYGFARCGGPPRRRANAIDWLPLAAGRASPISTRWLVVVERGGCRHPTTKYFTTLYREPPGIVLHVHISIEDTTPFGQIEGDRGTRGPSAWNTL